MLIKSVTSYQAEITYLEEALTLLLFLDFIFLLLEIESFASLKNVSLLFWTRVHFKGGEPSSLKF